MEIYLIRHTTPSVGRGICYGQTDLDVTESFLEEAGIIRRHLPLITSVHSSPLQRCSRLAGHLFPGHRVDLHDELMEIDCGEWEMRHWDDLPKEDIDPWMKDFVQVHMPGGESYLDLHARVTRCFDGIVTRTAEGVAADGVKTGAADGNTGSAAGEGAAAIVAHGGVIRSILSGITGTSLIDSFKAFALYYGCVVRLTGGPGAWSYEILSNRAPAEREQHKPKSFY